MDLLQYKYLFVLQSPLNKHAYLNSVHDLNISNNKLLILTNSFGIEN